MIAQYGSLVGTFSSVTGIPSGYTIDYALDGNKVALVGDGSVTGVPGRTPADNGSGGPLMVSKNLIDPTTLDLSWGASCGDAVSGYGVYEGSIGTFTSHLPLPSRCGLMVYSIPGQAVSSGDSYYLVVPNSASQGEEGSYGLDSAASERPPSAAACLPAQDLGACP